MNDSVAQVLAAHSLYPTDPWKMSLLVHATLCLGCAVVRAPIRTRPPGFIGGARPVVRAVHLGRDRDVDSRRADDPRLAE